MVVTDRSMAVALDIPESMEAIQYNQIKVFSLVTKPVPSPKAHEALIKGKQSKYTDANH